MNYFLTSPHTLGYAVYFFHTCYDYLSALTRCRERGELVEEVRVLLLAAEADYSAHV